MEDECPRCGYKSMESGYGSSGDSYSMGAGIPTLNATSIYTPGASSYSSPKSYSGSDSYSAGGE